MMAFTHGVIGAVMFVGASALTGTPEAMPLTGATLGAATVAAWVPDVDTPHSRAGWCVYPLALWLERRFGHRTITHSLVGTLIFALLCSPLLWLPSLSGSPALRGVWGALLCGYVSHLMADAATKSGVPLAWPSRARWVFPGNEDFRIRTGSRAELGLLIVFVLLGLLFVPVSRLGPRRLLHLATASLPGAVRDAEDWSQEWNLEVDVEGYDVVEQKMVSGRFPVVGRRDDGTIIIDRGGAHWALKETGAELHRIAPRHTRIQQAGRRRDRLVVLRASHVSLAALARVLGRLAGSRPSQVLVTGEGECYPFAPGSTPSDAPRQGLKTVKFGGGRVAFDFATPPHIEAAAGPGAVGAVALRDATLSVRLPLEAKVPRLMFAERREVVAVGRMRRHADLHVSPGQFVRRGWALNSPFAQVIQFKPSPQDELSQAQADAALRELSALGAEEDALRATTLWPRLRASFGARRKKLQVLAAWRPPGPKREEAPLSVRAPFDGVVEAVAWEPPTIPAQPGELPEHGALVTLSQVQF